jgi:hypothetical protein
MPYVLRAAADAHADVRQVSIITTSLGQMDFGCANTHV